MKTEIIILGVGGQGIRTLGNIISTAAFYEDKYASHWPTYGAATRGGPSISQVIISSERIDYPRCTAVDVLVAMDESLLKSYIGYLKPTGLLIADSDLVKSLPAPKTVIIKKIPAARIALDMEREVLINMVMLGTMLKITDVLSQEAVVRAIESTTPPSLKEENLEALRRGMQIEMV